MRKIPSVLAVLGLAAVGLVGCSASADASCARPSGADASLTNLVSVSGSDDQGITGVTLQTPLRVKSTQFADLKAGEGRALTDANGLLSFQLLIVDGESGKTLGNEQGIAPIAQLRQNIPALGDALQCVRVGGRTVVALAPGGIDPEIASGIGLDAKTSAVMVFDVQDVYASHAEGSLVFNDARGLPSVVRAPGGRPGIIVPDAPQPTKQVTQLLIRGNGDKVSGDRALLVNYTSVGWSDRRMLGTSWDGNPQVVSPGQDLDGFDGVVAALKGVTIGSQVMIVVPPAAGAAPGDSAKVFVVDVLGQAAASAQ